MNSILITTSSFGQMEILRQTGLEVVLNPFGRKLTEDEVHGLIQKHRPVGILAGVEPLTENVLQQAEGLKAISRCGVGMDSVDWEAARRLGIAVTNTPDAPTIPVAELTIGLILSLLRQVHSADASVRQGRWERPMGRLLYEKTVGIVGCGRIGSKVARMLSAFQCRVLAADPAHPQKEGVRLVELEELLASSDLVSLHLPYSPQTHHFMNHERLGAMKKGAYLINAARGGLVDEEALYKALTSGHLAGAALDCFEREPYSGDLAHLPNVLLTTHIGSYALEGRVLMETQAANNLIAQLQSQKVIA